MQKARIVLSQSQGCAGAVLISILNGSFEVEKEQEETDKTLGLSWGHQFLGGTRVVLQEEHWCYCKSFTTAEPCEPSEAAHLLCTMCRFWPKHSPFPSFLGGKGGGGFVLVKHWRVVYVEPYNTF